MSTNATTTSQIIARRADGATVVAEGDRLVVRDAMGAFAWQTFAARKGAKADARRILRNLI